MSSPEHLLNIPYALESIQLSGDVQVIKTAKALAFVEFTF